LLLCVFAQVPVAKLKDPAPQKRNRFVCIHGNNREALGVRYRNGYSVVPIIDAMARIPSHRDVEVVFVLWSHTAEIDKRCGELIEHKRDVCRYFDRVPVVLEATGLLAFEASLAMVSFVEPGDVHQPQRSEVAVEDMEGQEHLFRSKTEYECHCISSEGRAIGERTGFWMACR